jgi:hypothetical protein
MRNAAERSFWTLPDHPTERGIGIDRSPLTARPSASTPSPISRRTKVTTIEGLATEGALHALQQAFINQEAFQLRAVATCTAGFRSLYPARAARDDRTGGPDDRAVAGRGLRYGQAHDDRISATLSGGPTYRGSAWAQETTGPGCAVGSGPWRPVPLRTLVSPNSPTFAPPWAGAGCISGTSRRP